MSPQLRILLLLSPLLVGIIVAAINSEDVNNTTERFESWFRKNQSVISNKKNWFSRYVISPVLYVIVKFSDWTDNFLHRGLKNGTRVAITLYLIALWIYILYTLIMAAIMLVVIAVVIYVLFHLLINSNDNVKSGYEAGRRIIGPAGKGQRINPKTGIIQEEDLVDWKNTETRTNPDTGVIQKESFVGWENTETRTNQETGIIQKEGLIDWEDTETRINPGTGIIQKKGLVGWEDTDERIDPKSGKRQKKGLIGWEDT